MRDLDARWRQRNPDRQAQWACSNTTTTGPPSQPRPVASTKICPQCAETVKLAASVCRFCGYRFDEPIAPRRVRPRKQHVGGGAVVVLVIVGILYFTGKLDPLLANVGLNFHPCVKNGFGATFCGQDAKNYCQTLDQSGVNSLNSTSASVCAEINGSSGNP
jgi:hypothetical protein